MLADMPLKELIAELGSSSPAPGGGSVAALNGALSASLTSMVCRLTIGKERYASAQADMKAALAESKDLMEKMLALADRDAEAFNKVMGAFAMPKSNDDERAARSDALQGAYKGASEVPLETARGCLKAMELAKIALLKGNRNSATDAACAALCAEAGLKAAALNVRVNLSAIKGVEFTSTISAELAGLERGCEALAAECRGISNSKTEV